MKTILGDIANGKARKALVGAVVPTLVVIGAALTPDSPGGSAVTGQEWIAAAIAFLTSGAVVYAIPNRRTRSTTQDGSGTT